MEIYVLRQYLSFLIMEHYNQPSRSGSCYRADLESKQKDDKDAEWIRYSNEGYIEVHRRRNIHNHRNAVGKRNCGLQNNAKKKEQEERVNKRETDEREKLRQRRIRPGGSW